MCGTSMLDPHRAAFLVEQVPNPPTTGDFDLPLGKCASFVGSVRERSFELMMPGSGFPRSGTGVHAHGIPRPANIFGSCVDQLVPALCGFVRGEVDGPLCVRWRWGGCVAASWAHETAGGGVAGPRSSPSERSAASSSGSA